MPEKIKIISKEFAKGSNGLVKIDIADLPSGTKIDLPVHVFRSAKEGPVLLVCAGLHGDEVNGVEIIRQTLVQKYYSNLKRGSVIAMPLINIYGFINFSRAVPDGKDVNRSFPGSQKGSLAAQVANVLSKTIFPQIDFAIDCHTGGSARYNYPQIRYSLNDEKSKELALAFNPPVMLGNQVIDKSFRKEALKQGKSTIVFEGGESLRYDGFSIQVALRGIRKVLQHLQMIEPEIEKDLNDPNDPIVTHSFTKTTWQRAETSGLFIWEKSSGFFVKEGELLGSIHDPHNAYQIDVKAVKDGFILGHNNATVVNQGDALFHLAW